LDRHLFAGELDQVADAIDDAARIVHEQRTDAGRMAAEIVALDLKRNNAAAQ
jgi:hypothetical protein